MEIVFISFNTEKHSLANSKPLVITSFFFFHYATSMGHLIDCGTVNDLRLWRPVRSGGLHLRKIMLFCCQLPRPLETDRIHHGTTNGKGLMALPFSLELPSVTSVGVSDFIPVPSHV